MTTTTSDSSLLNLVAHEMRAPLTVIRGYLSLLSEGSLPDPAEAIRVVETKIAELDGLAEILASSARLESGEMPHQPIVFDVHEAVTTATGRVEARAQFEGASVRVFGTADPVWVYADRCQVSRVLTNLLANALTYSPPPADVVVEIRATNPIEVAVHDRGVGIVPEQHERIFERFVRYAERGTSRPAGLGLGLPLSRDLAELNGGQLVLERSAPGKGSTFVLRLPPAH
jgi:signal transduction histidine kinase